MSIEPFDCSATQRTNVSCILGVIVGDSLSHSLLTSQLRAHPRHTYVSADIVKKAKHFI